MDHWEETYQRAMDLYSSRLWSKRTAMKALGLERDELRLEAAMEAQAHRPADVDDWPPSERPEPEDLEAARLLGVEPRPPVREAQPMADGWWDEGPMLRGGKVQTMEKMVAALQDMKAAMEKNGAPQPNYVIVHPDQAKFLKGL